MIQTNDEIDLFDLIDDLKKQIKWIVGSVVVVVGLAGIYLLVTPPLYQATVTYTPVLAVDLLPLNRSVLVDEFGTKSDSTTASLEYVNAATIFSQSKELILSKRFFDAFYEEHPEINALLERAGQGQVTDTKLRSLFSLSESNKRNTPLAFTLVVSDQDPNVANQVIKAYAHFFAAQFQKYQLDNVYLDLSAIRARWQAELDALRVTYRESIDMRILELKEALMIAKAVDDNDFKNRSMLISGDTPLYVRGVNALQAEINVLNARKNDDLYISGVSELKWKIDQLDKQQNVAQDVRYLSDVDATFIAAKLIKPKSLLVLGMSLVLGGMLGVIAALMIAASKRRQERLDIERVKFDGHQS